MTIGQVNDNELLILEKTVVLYPPFPFSSTSFTYHLHDELLFTILPQFYIASLGNLHVHYHPIDASLLPVFIER